MINNKVLRISGLALTILWVLLVSIPVPVLPALALTGTLLVLEPASGPPNTVVNISGSGFTAGSTFNVYFNDSGEGSGQSLTTGTTALNGDITTSIAVPPFSPGGKYYITLTTSAGDIAIPQTFTVVPGLNLSADSGNVGDRITITGSGFSVNTTATIYLDSLSRLTTKANSFGMISVPYTLPGSTQGNHLITVVGSTDEERASVTFTTLPKVTVTPELAAAGAALTVTGTGFSSQSEISLLFDDTVITKILSGSDGGFTFGFPLPIASSGDHQIQVGDGSGNLQSKVISVTPGISILPITGTVGTPVTITGNGFKANETVYLSFSGSQLTNGKVSTNALGHFSITLNIPPVPSGIHQLSVSDGENNDSEDFQVKSDTVVSPVSGYIGTDINLSGTGFISDHQVTIIFNTVPVATAKSNTKGSFLSTFSVPTYPPGLYKITATDGINTSEVDFTVNSNVTISNNSITTPGYVGAPVEIDGIQFQPGSTVIVTYDAKRVTTGTVKDDGSFSVTFPAPASKYGEHTVTVSDGMTTLPFMYYMDSTSPLAPTLLQPETGMRQKAQSTFSWNPVSDPSGVTYVLQIADNMDFSPKSVLLEKKGLTLTEYTLTETEKLKATGKNAPYYWHVKAIDGASNESEWSNGWTFTVGDILPAWALWTFIIIGVLSVSLFAFWFGRRTATSRTKGK
jgi:hypothetical protein